MPQDMKLEADGAYSAKGLLTGRLNRLRLPAWKIARVAWSSTKACVEDEVKLDVELEGACPAKTASFKIFDHDDKGHHELVAELRAPVKENKVELPWKIEPPTIAHDATAERLAAQGFDHPDLFFEVTIAGEKGESGTEKEKLLIVSDIIDCEVVDDRTGEKIPGADYEVLLSNGQKRKGKLTAESRCVEKNVPPGKFDIEVFAHPHLSIEGPAKTEPHPTSPVDAAHHEKTAAVGPIGIHGLTFSPAFGKNGTPLKLEVRITGGKDGDPVTFRILPRGGSAPVAELTGTITKGTAEATWPVAGATGMAHPSGRFSYADFSFEVEYRGVKSTTLNSDRDFFRGFTPAA